MKAPSSPEIAKFAAQVAKNGLSKIGVLAAVKQQYPMLIPKLMMAENPKEYKIWGEDLIDQGAVKQLETALRIPPAKYGVLLPDAHLGYAMPIGGVILLENAISPSYIGFDISCMMMLSRYSINHSDFEKHRVDFAKQLRENTFFGIGPGPGLYEHPVLDDARWSISKAVNKNKRKAENQIGTSGGGNHFADLVSIDDGSIGLLTHSGSRGSGHNLAVHYTRLAAKETKRIAQNVPKDHGWLSMDSDAGREYFQAMSLMGDYAYANHELIHAEFAKVAGLEVVDMVWNRHNFAWETEDGFVHRKGATPAANGQMGLIPGSSGAPSYVVRGKGVEESLQSSSHGAGRPHSRTEAKKRHNVTAFNERMEDILHYGVNPDETFMAYKDIDEVISRQLDLIEVVSTMHPRVVVMGGKSDDGD